MEESHEETGNKSECTRKTSTKKKPNNGRELGTQRSWDKLNKRLEPLAQIHSTSGEVHWHASIREEWKELHILGDEGEEEEQETPIDEPEDMIEDNREEEDTNNDSEEEEEIPEHRRDENNEY